MHHLTGAHPILCEIEASAGSAHRDGDVGWRDPNARPELTPRPSWKPTQMSTLAEGVLVVVDRYFLRRECDLLEKQFSKRVGRSGIEVYDNFSATNLELLNRLRVA